MVTDIGPNDAVRQPAGGDEDGDRRRPLQHAEDAAAGQAPCSSRRAASVVAGRAMPVEPASARRSSSRVLQIRHHARRRLRTGGQKRLDLDAAGDVELVVDIGVEIGIGHGIDSCGHDGPPTILRWFFAVDGAASSISRSAARALPMRDISVPSGTPLASAACW